MGANALLSVALCFSRAAHRVTFSTILAQDMEAHNPMFQDVWKQNNTLRLYPQQVLQARK